MKRAAIRRAPLVRLEAVGATKGMQLVGAGLLAFGVAGSAGATIPIDGFVTTQSITADPIHTFADDEVAAPEALGGERDLFVQYAVGPASTSLSVNPFGSDAHLLFGNGLGTFGSASITWDGVDGSAGIASTGLGGVDLTEGGADDRFAFDALADTDAFVGITVFDASDATGATSSTGSLQVVATSDLATYTLRFADFIQLGPNGPADFSNVGAIQMAVQGGGGLDIAIESLIVTAPEPRGLAATATAALGLCTLHRRSRARETEGRSRR